MLAFFLSPIGRVVGFVLIGVVLAGALWGAYQLHIKSVRDQAFAEAKAAQMEQLVQDQQTFLNHMRTLNDEARRYEEENRQKIELFNQKLGGLEQFLSSPETIKQNRGSSEILKRTVRELGGE